jgi:hypothetical protein
MDSSSWKSRLFPPRKPAGDYSARDLPFPEIADPEALPLRTERLVTHSIATIRKRLTVGLAKTLDRCPCCCQSAPRDWPRCNTRHRRKTRPVCGPYGFGLQRGFGFGDLGDPFLFVGDPLRHLVAAFGASVRRVFFSVRRSGQPFGHFGLAFRHPLVTHRLMFRRVGFDLGAIERDVAGLLPQPGQLRRAGSTPSRWALTQIVAPYQPFQARRARS